MSALDFGPLVLGGNTFGWTSDRDESFAVLDKFADAGGRSVDTADSYSAWVPGTSGGESETRWYTVWAYGPLAGHFAGSLAKGDMVTVRADDITCRAWTDERDPGQKPRAQAELRAYDVAASMRFEYLVTAKAARAGAELNAPAADGDPWAGEQAEPQREVPEVLAGLVTQPA